MKRALSELLDIICFLGLFLGIVMMMCECQDAHEQDLMLIRGLCTFMICAVPLIIKSARGDYQPDASAEPEHKNMF